MPNTSKNLKINNITPKGNHPHLNLNFINNNQDIIIPSSTKYSYNGENLNTNQTYNHSQNKSVNNLTPNNLILTNYNNLSKKLTSKAKIGNSSFTPLNVNNSIGNNTSNNPITKNTTEIFLNKKSNNNSKNKFSNNNYSTNYNINNSSPFKNVNVEQQFINDDKNVNKNLDLNFNQINLNKNSRNKTNNNIISTPTSNNNIFCTNFNKGNNNNNITNFDSTIKLSGTIQDNNYISNNIQNILKNKIENNINVPTTKLSGSKLKLNYDGLKISKTNLLKYQNKRKSPIFYNTNNNLIINDLEQNNFTQNENNFHKINQTSSNNIIHKNIGTYIFYF